MLYRQSHIKQADTGLQALTIVESIRNLASACLMREGAEWS